MCYWNWNKQCLEVVFTVEAFLGFLWHDPALLLSEFWNLYTLKDGWAFTLFILCFLGHVIFSTSCLTNLTARTKILTAPPGGELNIWQKSPRLHLRGFHLLCICVYITAVTLTLCVCSLERCCILFSYYYCFILYSNSSQPYKPQRFICCIVGLLVCKQCQGPPTSTSLLGNSSVEDFVTQTHRHMMLVSVCFLFLMILRQLLSTSCSTRVVH